MEQQETSFQDRFQSSLRMLFLRFIAILAVLGLPAGPCTGNGVDTAPPSVPTASRVANTTLAEEDIFFDARGPTVLNTGSTNPCNLADSLSLSSASARNHWSSSLLDSSNPLPLLQKHAFRYSVGYVGSWSNTRDCMAVEPEQINASPYSHIIFAYGTVSSRNRLSLEGGKTQQDYLFRLVRHVRVNHPSVKVLISVGGYSFNRCKSARVRFFRTIRSLSRREFFIQSVLTTLSEYNLDGVDFDWESPSFDEATQRGNEEPLLAFFKQLRYLFGDWYTLSYAITLGNTWSVSRKTAAALSQYLDFMTVMAYDLHGPMLQNSFVDQVMLPHTDFREVHLGLNILLGSNIPKEKLLLGLALWGHVYTQLHPEQDMIGSPYADPRQQCPSAGRCTGISGYLGYNEISELLSDKKKCHVRYNYRHRPSLTNVLTYAKDQWVTYDNPLTITERIQYASMLGLGGFSVLYVDLDDDKHSMSKAVIAGMKWVN